ncbi:glycogen debranching enzyme isoform X4 [Dendroctonus ponderosae]|uniref:glycogen debranching enzyme isoform X4 n=1 Tax=Dendroctonus ponderosae TaxID=77166 RepID=UPI0020358E5F|nr:glycogen debranching enzyme isoform X4 [Dendroctonus ponderosae]
MNESTVPVTAIGGIILLIVCSKRIRSKMASLASWLFGRVAGAAPENQTDQNIGQATTSGKNISHASIVTNTVPVGFEASRGTSALPIKEHESASSLEASGETAKSFDDFVHVNIDEENGDSEGGLYEQTSHSDRTLNDPNRQQAAEPSFTNCSTECVDFEVENSSPKCSQIETVENLKIPDIRPGECKRELSAVENRKLNDEPEHPKYIDMASVNILILNDKANLDSELHRIQKNVKLEFRLGPSLLGRNIKLYCNYPKSTNGIVEEFSRDCYTLIRWSRNEGCKNADGSSTFAQITPTIAGSFHYYFVEDDEFTKTNFKNGSGYFIVDPVLKYGANELLPLNCIQSQTVLSKLLGPFSTWENKIRVAKESGYNMVHFTPIQQLGGSHSAYSVQDHLKLNVSFNEENGREPSFEDIETLTAKMREDWKMLSVCDIVINHTANESDWIKEHPEAAYNCLNCPYMRPAYLLDEALHQFSMDIRKGLYEDRGIPLDVSTEDHLNAIRYHFKQNVLQPLKIHELFIVDVTQYLEQFLTQARKTAPLNDCERNLLPDLKIIQDVQFRRLSSSVDLNLALAKFNCYRPDCYDEESRVRRCAEDFKIQLDALNQAAIDEVTADLSAAVENVIAGIRYFRVQPDGPQYKAITIDHPLVYRYFTDYHSPKSLAEAEETMYSTNGRFLMAHNGWVMSAEPLKNFADAGTKIYIRRELIAWGDSVKLRFGDKPADSPFLWNYMRQYVEQTVKIFDGIRLDNCHSTSLPVAEYLLDCARRIRPDLYVVAELFTNSALTDNIFVNRLGITSLIREAMSAWDAHEQGRLVYRFGGVPVGAFYKPSKVPLVPMVAHALFLDQTHDNPSPVEKRSVFDLLPSAGLVNMACCATGSNRGYDELVPHHIHVVDETRQYAEWSHHEKLPSKTRYVNKWSGIIAAKRALHELHFKLGMEGFDQVFVNQVDGDIVEVTRHQPGTHTSYVLVAFTAFEHPTGDHQRAIKPLSVEGVLDEIVLEAYLIHADSTSRFGRFEKFEKDPDWINGLAEYKLSIKEHIQLRESEFFEEAADSSSNFVRLNYKNFKPGSIAVLKFSLPQGIRDAISLLKPPQAPNLEKIVSELTLADLNRTLFRCGEEERDEGNGFDTYNIPNFGPTIYCGLFGITWVLRQIATDNDLGHPLCTNLRNGNWLIEYVFKRLKADEGTRALGEWIEDYSKPLLNMPRYLVPCYFDVFIGQIYPQLLNAGYQLMSNFIKQGSPFVQSLALGSLQFGGYLRSACLPDMSPNLAPPKPPSRKNENGETVQACVTLSAGLPHFAVGYMRNWGRDTFIALRGLFILTGRFEEARQHILGYGSCLRHGLIPNLLDAGRNPRFNCRDAIWWWLYSLKSYCEESPKGVAILADVVSRIFPSDDSSPQPPGAVDQPLYDVIQESLTVHFQGLQFRERNAGREIDEHMTDAGFNNQIGTHPETGFVFGGNEWNCGTWMDKMGSSDKAGNRGKPASPRDGSAVELVGLSKACITWLMHLNDEGQYPYDGVQRTHKNGTVTKWTFREWSDKIQQNFEKKFWISGNPNPEECRPDLVNKKNIYKDSFGASQPWTDFQLRCNFPIAMVAAPELFNPQRAWAALEQVEKYLLGPLGMKTLDPEDWNYRGDYDNSIDSDDLLTAHGFNYHQGPEWVWPVGFFLRAKLIFAAQNGLLDETVTKTKQILSKHFIEVETPPWRGLPELTNSDGSYCPDSARTQAWSMSCILEVLYDLEKIESNRSVAN